MNTLAFGLYLLFMISWFLQLPTRLPVLGALRFDLVLVVFASAATTVSGLRPARTSSERSTRLWLKILFAYVLVTLPLVEWPGSVMKFGIERLLKAAVFYFFTAQLVTSKERLKNLLVVFLVCQSIRVFEPLYLHVTTGYWGSQAMMANWEMMDRLAGAPSDVINPNGLAFVILTVLSFGHLFMTSRIGSAAYLASLPLHLYTLVLTGSRSGFLGLIAVFGLVWWNSRRKVLLLAAAGIVVLVAAPRLGENTVDRYLSIFGGGTLNEATAAGRVEGVKDNFRVAMRRPLFGHGLGTSAEANFNFGGYGQLAHNLYAETAQELGFVGLTIFLALITAIARGTVVAARATVQTDGSHGFLNRLALSLQVFLGMNLLFSLASYGLTSYEWYLMAGLSEALVGLVAATQMEPKRQPVTDLGSCFVAVFKPGTH